MSNNNLPATMNDLINGLDQASTAIASAIGEGSFIKMTKQGEWVYGADDTEVDEGSEWVVNTGSFFNGYQSWDTDGELLGEEKVLMTEPPITRAQLDDVGAPWKPMLGCEILCISGKDKGVKATFGSTAKGGIEAVNNLVKEVVANAKNPNNEGKYTALVKLENTWYKHKQYGKIFKPVFEVIEFIADDDEEIEEASAQAQQAEEPQAEQVEQAEPEVVEEPQQATPSRSRRRRRS